jgi:hypothetical protein
MIKKTECIRDMTTRRTPDDTLDACNTCNGGVQYCGGGSVAAAVNRGGLFGCELSLRVLCARPHVAPKFQWLKHARQNKPNDTSEVAATLRPFDGMTSH